MPLEQATNISSLDSQNPTPADPKSDGDDHLRMIKLALLNGLGGFPGAILRTGTDGGAVNAYTITMTPALASYGNRMIIAFTVPVANTGVSTININGLGTRRIKKVTGADVVLNDLVPGVIYLAAYNGTEFRLLSVTRNEIDQLQFQSALPAQALGFLRSSGAAAGFTTTHTGYAQNEVLGSPIASANTVNLTAATGNLVHITGVATISAITIPIGAERVVIFDSTPTLVNSAVLLLPGGADIAVAAGDRMTVRGDASGAIVTSYDRADGNSVGAIPFLHVREQSTSSPGNSISGTQDRVLNTVVTNTISGASLASNQITLPAGTYDFEISAPAQGVAGHRALLQNITDNTYPGVGTSEFSGNTSNTTTRSTISGRMSIAAPKGFKVRHYTTGAVTSGLGNLSLSPEVGYAVYTEARFWKVA